MTAGMKVHAVNIFGRRLDDPCNKAWQQPPSTVECFVPHFNKGKSSMDLA